jgi:hypothetical protein
VGGLRLLLLKLPRYRLEAGAAMSPKVEGGGSARAMPLKVAVQLRTRKAICVGIFTGLGTYATFRPLFLSTIVSPAQVGSIMFIGSVVTTVTNPLIAALADQMRLQKPLMLLSTAAQAATQLAMLVPGQGYLGMLVWNTVHSITGAHFNPTFDASCMAVCPERYGDIRLLGSLAFGIAAFGGGGLISLAGKSTTTAFAMAFGMSSAAQLACLPMIARLDVSALHVTKGKAPSTSSSPGAPKSGASSEPPVPSGIASLIKLCSDPKMLFFLSIAMLSGWQCSLIDSFFNIHLSAIGAPGVLMGTARLLTCLAELPAFRMSHAILTRLGVSGSFALAQAAYVLRFLWYVNLKRIASWGPWGIWAVLPIELLHGLTFAVNWSALSTHCSRVAPPVQCDAPLSLTPCFPLPPLTTLSPVPVP